MPDYSLPIYDKPRAWITTAREQKNWSWEDIQSLRNKTAEERQRFFDDNEDMNFWPHLTIDDWNELVRRQKDAAERVKFVDILAGRAQIQGKGQDNAVEVPKDPASSWQLYRSKLLRDGFKEETVDEIERTTIRILKRLNNDTTETEPVKGLVIGNVQSGKTANMAALMAMAADWGWNMFIILSGTIENLRIQTQKRLFNDLNQQGTMFWRSLEHLSKTVDISQKAQSLHFDSASKERYFTVCLKNSSRLTKLIQWMQADSNKQKQMKVLVIDDEADQASINTADVTKEERKRINERITSLVEGLNEKGQEIPVKYKAMNYIGYTATPYANILNESPGKGSLYPKDFITTLAVSKEYFGPQQIFGFSGDADASFDGLKIVRVIDKEQLDEIKSIHDNDRTEIPDSLKDAVSWFLCGVSCMRIWGYKKPVSMLVHTSQKTAHHQQIADVIHSWLTSASNEEIIQQAESVWRRETAEFSFEDFKEEYPQYDIPDDQINRYPEFDKIREQIDIILEDGIMPIMMDEEYELNYHRGVHLCIDNCANNGVTSDGMHMRLAYPDPEKMPSPAPAFIVVGGATLSRGLTLEGLISTFFLRSVGQADSLMQMGRWFGYRKHYELLPRIWITEKTNEQFKFLAELDQNLRDEILYMDLNGRSPAEYGPKVKNSPKVSFIRITAKNKMQSATESEMDYSGASNQTYLFDNDSSTLENNIVLTDNFLAGLGAEWKRTDGVTAYKGNAIWKGIPFSKVRAFLSDFKFQERLSVFNDIKPLLDWIGKMTDDGKLGDWSVIVGGKNTGENGEWILPNNHIINKIRRTRKTPKREWEESIINIGVLREPSDLLCDIDLDAITDEEIKKETFEYIQNGTAKAAMAIRDKAGMETTPQLIIYRIDKDSDVFPNYKGSERTKLGALKDIIGLSLYIPGGRIGTSYVSAVSIKLNNDIFDGDADLEGTDEN